jgi:ABC-type phosphate transport system substrate-binding protein
MKEIRMVRGVAVALVLLMSAVSPAFSVSAQTATDEAVAIVVHPDVAVDNLSMDQLKSIFLAEQQRWPNRSRITLLVRAAQAHERDVILNSIYGMSEDRYRQYWIAKMFRAEVASGPKIVFSTDMVRGLVSVIPGSIGFVPVSEVGSDLKVISIDGKLPGDAGYALR